MIRGGYGIFYGPVDAQINQVDLSLGVLNKNHSTVENQHNSSQVPNQVDNVVGTCGISFAGSPIFPGSGGTRAPVSSQFTLILSVLPACPLPRRTRSLGLSSQGD